MKEVLEFTRPVINDYNLQNKQLFKKSAGKAKYYYQLEFNSSLDNDLKQISKLYKEKVPFKIYGMHTNLYITENGYDGYFIDYSPKYSSIRFDKEKEEFIVSSNVPNSKLVNYAINLGYDFASLTGIPGMVGSGVTGNSSWATGKDYGEYVKEITLFDFEKGEYTNIVPDDKFFTTRNSYIKQQNVKNTRYFVKSVVLKSEYIGKEAAKEKQLKQINQRLNSLKVAFKEGCAGSIWSNIDLRNKVGKPFRKILEEIPELNVDINGARYSKYESRFFITTPNTKDKDVAKLLKLTVDKLQERYKVKPIKEVVILDSDGEIDLDTFIKRNTRG